MLIRMARDSIAENATAHGLITLRGKLEQPRLYWLDSGEA